MIFDSWMKYIVPTAPMNRLIMPGAHNACTAGMNKMSCCQNGSLVDQMRYGVRHFCIRLDTDRKGNIVCCHGIAKGLTLSEALSGVKEFMDEHPEEVMLFDVREYYDQKGYTAAHKNLPLPSYVKVTNLENGKMVIVRVNDRGPFHGSRIIDLSEGAAKAIDMTKKGTARVKLELINTRTNNTTTEGGHGTGAIIAQSVINEIITNNTSSTTRNNLEKLGNYFDEKKANGEVSNSTKVAAIGAGLYFAGKVGSALAEASEDSGSSSNTSKSLVSSNSRSSNSVTSTITTTTTNSLGETTTNQTVSTKSFAPSNANYEIDYALPPPQVNTTTASNTSVASGSLVDAATGKALASGSYVQLFSSSTLDGATKAKTRIAQQTSYPVVIMAEDGLFRVRIGPVPEMSIGQALEQMRQAGYADAFIKHL